VNSKNRRAAFISFLLSEVSEQTYFDHEDSGVRFDSAANYYDIEEEDGSDPHLEHVKVSQKYD
jgi:hypothetical protein